MSNIIVACNIKYYKGDDEAWLYCSKSWTHYTILLYSFEYNCATNNLKCTPCQGHFWYLGGKIPLGALHCVCFTGREVGQRWGATTHDCGADGPGADQADDRVYPSKILSHCCFLASLHLPLDEFWRDYVSVILDIRISNSTSISRYIL